MSVFDFNLVGLRICRNLPFDGRATRGSRVRLPRKENVWSRHQHFFDENARKIKRTKVCVFWKWGFESCLCMGKVLALHMPVTRDGSLQSSVQNMTSKLYIFLFYILYVFSLFYVLRKSDLGSSLRIEHWLNCLRRWTFEWSLDFWKEGVGQMASVILRRGELIFTNKLLTPF